MDRREVVAADRFGAMHRAQYLPNLGLQACIVCCFWARPVVSVSEMIRTAIASGVLDRFRRSTRTTVQN